VIRKLRLRREQAVMLRLGVTENLKSQYWNYRKILLPWDYRGHGYSDFTTMSRDYGDNELITMIRKRLHACFIEEDSFVKSFATLTCQHF